MEHTLKFKYKCLNDNDFKEFLSEVRRQYTICVHYLINRLLDSDGSLSEKDLRSMQSLIQNIDLIDSWYFQGAVKESILNYKSFKKKYDEHEDAREKDLKDLKFKHSIGKISDHKYKIKKEKILKPLTLVFGGHENMSKRQKGQITKEEFKENRLRNLCVIGEAPKGGNRKMLINPDLSLLFKYDKGHHLLLSLNIPDSNHRQKLIDLFNLSHENKISITYRFINDKEIHISYDKDVIDVPVKSKLIDNRVFSIDLNPNYIGWSVTDWKSSSEYNVIDYGVLDMKKLSDIYHELNKLGNVKSDDPRRIKLSDKKTYETNIIGHNLIDKALHYKCQVFSVEDLNIKQKDRDKGKDFNALCNNHWLRTVLMYQIEKGCSYHKMNLLKVKPEYSSFIGNLIFRHIDSEMPDMVLSSIEISRRGYEFYNQYIIKTKEKQKNIIQPNLKDFEDCWKMSLEILELNPVVDKSINSFIKLYELIKNRKNLPFKGDPYKVRVSFNPMREFRFFSHKSKVFTY